MESTITPQLATNSSETITNISFLTFGYWFFTPAVASLNHWTMALAAAVSTLLLILVLVIVGVKILNSRLTPPQQKFLTKVAWSLAAFGPLGWVLILSRLSGVVFFSARFWWILWVAALIATLVWLYRGYKKLPTQQAQYESYQLKKRYFPKKKKR